MLYVTFWVGLVPASLLLGPVWRVANPLRLVHRGLRVLLPAAPGAGRLPALGLWPAAVSLLVFLWLELVFPGRAEPVTRRRLPRRLRRRAPRAGRLVRRGVVRRAATASRSTPRSSPGSRRGDGGTTAGSSLRNPLANALAAPEIPGLAAVVVVLLGSTAFDGLSRTVFWQTGPGAANDSLSGTARPARDDRAGRRRCTCSGTRLSGRLAGQPPGDPAAPVRGAPLIPIALGYTVAHYFSLLVLDGQTTWILASNPFGLAGVDLFGTYGNVVDLTAVSSDAIALVQVGAVVTGHVLGVTLAHERALLSARRARASDQLPLVIVMVLFTVGGLGLLFGF